MNLQNSTGGGEQSTLDLLNFENVRDGGVIETPTAYTMLVEIEPREWLTLSEERRTSLYISYMTFLRGLQFPTQFLTLTTRFDGDHYLQRFIGPQALGAPTGQPTAIPAEDGEEQSDGVVEAHATDGGVAAAGVPPEPNIDHVADSTLLEYGRVAHAEWLDRTIALANVRDRRFFVAVAVMKGEDDEGGRFDAIADALPFGGGAKSVDDEDQYLDEVWARVQRVASQLPRTRVETSILDNRADVLDVLYQVYRGQEPPISFEHSVFTQPDEKTLSDPATGEQLDLEEAFDSADREATLLEPDEDPEPRPETTGDLPYEGRVQTEYVEQVDNSRILAWYARAVGPIGRGTNYHSPLSVYAGVGLFTASLLFAVTALGVFLGSGQPGSESYWAVREASFGLAAGSLPTFLLSLAVLLPSSQRATIVGFVGVGVTAVAVYLFSQAYPFQWDSTPTASTAFVIEVYAVGLLLLVIGVALAVRGRRNVLEHFEDLDETIDDSRKTESPTEEADV
ncbi:DUF7139 domain-containing protein [Haloarcula onubensis]|uniref:Cell division protein A N-terminal domain-containing protein n=1 Tax=Haloarcula onubensis TaxID=2950539 RepID=A0ABU2FT78_9EURY|nr:hypothetical protein [Halomicroarcula sp. S3CR25-11]MDS0283968.1 hypothetical protein [Halomicroarcula sp. S3CR25-11]